MSYGIYKVDTEEFLLEWDKAHGREPRWISADKRHRGSYMQYTTRSEAEQDKNALEDIFRFAVIVVNLENKQL